MGGVIKPRTPGNVTDGRSPVNRSGSSWSDTVYGGSDSLTSLKAVLSGILHFLSPLLGFEALLLLLRDTDRRLVRLYAVESSVSGIHTMEPLATENDELSALTFEKQQAVTIPDVEHEVRFPSAVSRAKLFGIRSISLAPFRTASGLVGTLGFGSLSRREFSQDDVEMLQRVANGLAPLIEAARLQELARHRENRALRERDQLSVLLEINNLIISYRTPGELITAVSSTLRRWYHHSYTGLWVLTDKSKLRCIGLDFPDGRGLIENITPELDLQQMEKENLLRPHVNSLESIRALPVEVSQSLLEEGITNQVVIPLRTRHRFLGFLSLGSMQQDCFREEDLPLLAQIGGQIALATENALVFQELSQAHEQLKSEKLYLESELYADQNFAEIVGQSQAIKSVLEQVAVVAKSGATVLLLGETGTGKELIARAIHNMSERKGQTFVRLNCAAIPSGLVESELFGHEKGAFTGALTQKIGRFELAHKGTLLLDEVGDIPLELQIKLLRTLQEREFERLGSTRTIKVDVRVVAATNRDLSELIRNGQFREDLFYRLNVFPIRIPPLRERREDIPLLIKHFVALFSRRMRKDIRSIPSETLAKLTRMPWPGNIRELQNVIERAVILTEGETLRAMLPEPETAAPPKKPAPAAPVSKLEDIERTALLEALRRARGRISGPGGAAALLGLKRTTFHSKMHRFNIERSDIWRD